MRTSEDRRVVKIGLTDAGNTRAAIAPQVAQGLLLTGLDVPPLQKLQDISAGLEELMHILGAQELPPRLILSPEINLSKGQRCKKRCMRLCKQRHERAHLRDDIIPCRLV